MVRTGATLRGRRALKALEQAAQRLGLVQIPHLREHPIAPLTSEYLGGEAPELELDLAIRQRVPAVPLRMARLRHDLPPVRGRHLDARAGFGRVAPRELGLLDHGQLLDE